MTEASSFTGGQASAQRAPTEFDWRIYADGTFAAMALLLPIPFVDAAIEEIFRRRMPRTIARRRGRTLPTASIQALNRSRDNVWAGCLTWPVRALVYLVRNLYRTVLYVLTVVDASDKLSHYWHRAFLIDYALQRGHLDDPARAEIAAQAIHHMLATTETSPLRNLAREVIENMRRQVRGVFRTVLRALRRQEEMGEMARTRTTITGQWAEFQDYLIELANDYEAYLAGLVHGSAPDSQPGSGELKQP